MDPWASFGAQTLHVFGTASAAEALAEAGLPGRTVLLRDPVCEGPAPAGLREAAWYAVRAAHLVATGVPAPPAALARRLADTDAAVATAPEYDEVVLWFDACLYDQLLLCRTLEQLSRLVLRRTRVSLIVVGAFPGFAKFCGLGELTAAQLATLAPTRQRLTMAEQKLARQAWAAYRASDPTAIVTLIEGDTSALPYLGPALRRHLEQFPAVRNGLSRLEHEALAALVAGATQPGDIFAATAAQEERPFFGDTTLWVTLERLAHGAHPLVSITGPGPRLATAAGAELGAWSVRATPTGHAVLAGRDDWVWLNGIDRWLGGVRLQGAESPWRWDTARARLLRVP